MNRPSAIIWDLDLTLVDSSSAMELRRERAWPQVYSLIPGFRLYEGVDEMLASARAASLSCALVTSAPRPYAQRVIAHFGFKMDVLVCYHDTRCHKPEPDPIELAISRLGVAASEVWSVGDELRDIEASRAAGAVAVAALWGAADAEALRQARPDIVADSPADLGSRLVPCRD